MGFLMRRGFTLVWSGWQGDVPPGKQLKAYRKSADEGDPKTV